MITFLICLSLLVLAYIFYGRYLEHVCQIDSKAEVPSKRLYDGVDYIPLPRWRTFLIQLLNIAGVGPIFGAIMGACFGPVAFLWITLGGIFMGAMHDYISGVIVLRHDGLSLPEIIGHYLGNNVRQVMRVFSIFLLVLVGAVFVLEQVFPILSRQLRQPGVVAQNGKHIGKEGFLLCHRGLNNAHLFRRPFHFIDGQAVEFLFDRLIVAHGVDIKDDNFGCFVFQGFLQDVVGLPD